MNTSTIKEERSERSGEYNRHQIADVQEEELDQETGQDRDNSRSPKPEPDISQGEEEMDTSASHNIRGVSKSGRRVKRTQLYGFQVDSNLSGIFVSEYDTSDFDKKQYSDKRRS